MSDPREFGPNLGDIAISGACRGEPYPDPAWSLFGAGVYAPSLDCRRRERSRPLLTPRHAGVYFFLRPSYGVSGRRAAWPASVRGRLHAGHGHAPTLVVVSSLSGRPPGNM